MNDVHFSSKSNEWQTPKYLFDWLNKEYNFKLDAAATKDNALCDNYYTIEDNALLKDWSGYGSVFCNPPYGRLIGKFVEKGYLESRKGSIVVFLIPARTDTRWWYNYCSKGNVIFLKGRVKFISNNSPSKNLCAPFPSAIVIFDKNIELPKTEYKDIKGILK